jgi:hypothetical protein
MGFLHKPILHILLITAVGILAYSNTFNVPFHLDDYDAIVDNPMITDLNYFVESSKAKEFTKDFAGSYRYNLFKQRYIGSLTFALNYKFHGLNITGYHIISLLIHIVNALLVYCLIILTLRTPLLRNSDSNCHSHLMALLGALFFISHPIQTQAVTYITQRYASLATLFCLVSITMYIQSRLTHSEEITERLKSKRKFRLAVYYFLSIISAVLAMKTKEMAFTLPVIIALYEVMFFEGRLKSRILYLIPFLLTMLIIPLTLIGIDKPLEDLIGDVSETTKGQANLSRLDYLFTQFRVIVTYIRLLFLPINQALIYDYPIYYSFFDPNVILSFLFLSVILGLGVYLLYRSRSAYLYSRLIAFGIFSAVCWRGDCIQCRDFLYLSIILSPPGPYGSFPAHSLFTADYNGYYSYGYHVCKKYSLAG